MTPDQRDLLHALAYLYLRHGQNRRALTLALLAARDAPDDVGVLRTLAYAFVANDAPEEALEVIERLEKLDFAGGAGQIHRLLKARALLHAGRRVEAKAVFRQFVEMRGTKGEALTDVGADDRMVYVDPDPLSPAGEHDFVPPKDRIAGPESRPRHAARMT
jgi:type III secretion protein Y